MVRIRKSKQNPDYWVVVGGGKTMMVLGKERAQEIAAARKRLIKKGRRK
ncbi:MAG: hypothetical protein K6T57_14625 [Thermaceae bacterium]|nr:hypothetical protein [Thermaceae bacterium]